MWSTKSGRCLSMFIHIEMIALSRVSLLQVLEYSSLWLYCNEKCDHFTGQTTLEYDTQHTWPNLFANYSSYWLLEFLLFRKEQSVCLSLRAWASGWDKDSLRGKHIIVWATVSLCDASLCVLSVCFWCLLCQGLPGTLLASRMSWI